MIRVVNVLVYLYFVVFLNERHVMHLLSIARWAAAVQSQTYILFPLR